VASDGELYLAMYPRLARRWMNQCVVCQRKGYKPGMPDQIGIGVAANNLRRFFDPLNLSEDGRCDQCRIGSQADSRERPSATRDVPNGK
jgi:hypothetical protein